MPTVSRGLPQPAYVLHQWAWSETSLILDLFTRGRGRLAAVAKGAKRPYSQLRPVLMPFQRVMVTLGRGAVAARAQGGEGGEGGEILTLRAAEYAGAGAVLPPARLMSGFYLNELLLKLLARGDAHEALFDAYADTLQALAQGPSEGQDEAALRAFELVLLRQTGVLPELDRNTQTQAALNPQRAYVLRPETGLVLADASDDNALAAPLCLALERALGDRPMAALRAACQADLPGLRQQLRPLLHYHLGSPQLRTRQVMLEVRRLLDAAAPAALTDKPS
jgi:DNA repair protein RecO (recombination protein O)